MDEGEETLRARARAGIAGPVELGSLDLPRFRLGGDQLEVGPSLANGKCWVSVRGSGDVDRVFATDVGRAVMGAMSVRYALPSTGESTSATWTLVSPTTSGSVEIHPAYFRRYFSLPAALSICETVFVPRRAGPELRVSHDGAIVYQRAELFNAGAKPVTLALFAFAQLAGETPPDVAARVEPLIRQGALVAINRSQPQWARIIGIEGADAHETAYATLRDATAAYDHALVPALTNDCRAEGDVIGALQVCVTLPPGETRTLAVITAFSPEGEGDARRLFAHAWDHEAALAHTIRHVASMTQLSRVLSPDPAINEAVVWSKVNMLRVMSDYPTGRAFTNDPGHSSDVVARDAAWFSSGCDYLYPQFSRDLLFAFARRQQPSGKIIEYYHALTDAADDYGLNINDNTPLFIAAAEHYIRVSGDREALPTLYAATGRAARYIISQLDTHLPAGIAPARRGLVFCTARGTGVRGIAGWRNILEGRTINGAVTEINAECAEALRSASRLARAAGFGTDAEEFRRAADDLTGAINHHLLNPANGYYYLNRDVDDRARADVTADELFPVVFGIAPEPVARRIIDRLLAPDFWTPAGIRTVSRASADYNPLEQAGLRGGVWPGVTWWLAIAAARYYPGLLAQTLRASFLHTSRDPCAYNAVPGQFSEWLDGESLVNRGMHLSPWEPPRFLWAAIEGMCGVTAGYDHVRVRPALPMEWSWVGLRRLPIKGRELSYFAARHDGLWRYYSTGDLRVDAGADVAVFDEDVTDRVVVSHAAAQCLALRRSGMTLVCVGNASAERAQVTLDLEQVRDGAGVTSLATFNSRSGSWEFAQVQAQEQEVVTLTLDPAGYGLVALHAAQ